MAKVVDNFDIVREHMTFETQFDRYIVHILCRPKDFPNKEIVFGKNEKHRLIKTFYLDSLTSFDSKKEAIKTLCRTNNARAYFLPQVRNNEDCLLNLIKVAADNLKNPSANANHLINSAYCGYHASRAPRWVIDIDKEDIEAMGVNGTARAYACMDLDKKICDLVKEVGHDSKDVWMNWSVTGLHIVTPKFNPMKFDEKFRNKIKKDGMTLLYFEEANNEGKL